MTANAARSDHPVAATRSPSTMRTPAAYLRQHHALITTMLQSCHVQDERALYYMSGPCVARVPRPRESEAAGAAAATGVRVHALEAPAPTSAVARANFAAPGLASASNTYSGFAQQQQHQQQQHQQQQQQQQQRADGTATAPAAWPSRAHEHAVDEGGGARISRASDDGAAGPYPPQQQLQRRRASVASATDDIGVGLRHTVSTSSSSTSVSGTAGAARPGGSAAVAGAVYVSPSIEWPPAMPQQSAAEAACDPAAAVALERGPVPSRSRIRPSKVLTLHVAALLELALDVPFVGLILGSPGAPLNIGAVRNALRPVVPHDGSAAGSSGIAPLWAFNTVLRSHSGAISGVSFTLRAGGILPTNRVKLHLWILTPPSMANPTSMSQLSGTPATAICMCITRGVASRPPAFLVRKIVASHAGRPAAAPARAVPAADATYAQQQPTYVQLGARAAEASHALDDSVLRPAGAHAAAAPAAVLASALYDPSASAPGGSVTYDFGAASSASGGGVGSGGGLLPVLSALRASSSAGSALAAGSTTMDVQPMYARTYAHLLTASAGGAAWMPTATTSTGAAATSTTDAARAVDAAAPPFSLSTMAAPGCASLSGAYSPALPASSTAGTAAATPTAASSTSFATASLPQAATTLGVSVAGAAPASDEAAAAATASADGLASHGAMDLD